MPISAQDESKLLAAAQMAAGRAYAPYSSFPVGAAILTGDGSIVAGCNVENASFGLTTCAERNAIFAAVASGKNKDSLRLRAVLVYTPTKFPTAPCGACRQVINEFGEDVEIVCCCDDGKPIRSSIAELLPKAFGPHNLGQS